MSADRHPLQVDGVSFGFSRSEGPLFSELSLSIPPGQIHGIFGNNGSGKTTLFNLLCGLLVPAQGTIKYYGVEVAKPDPQTIARIGGGLARTFQVPSLIDELSLEENLLLSHRGAGERFSALVRRVPPEPRTAIDLALAEFGLSDLRHVPLGELSYGTRRLATVILALLTGARLVLLDEPFANLDAATVERLMHVMRREANLGRSFLLIEHPPHHILQIVQVLHFLDGSLVSCTDPAAMREEIERFVYERR